MSVSASILEEVLEEGGVSPTGQTPRSLIYRCPHCDKPKLYLLKEGGRFVCWYCRESRGFEGRPERAVADLLEIGIEEARRRLVVEDAPGEEIEGVEDIFDLGTEERKIPEVFWPERFLTLGDPRAVAGAAYLEDRGIPSDIAAGYGIRFDPLSCRVAFPVLLEGRLVGWQARLTEPRGDVPKYLSSPGLPRDRVLMFSERLTGARAAVLTEGPLDALKAHLVGGNVATMGKAVANTQLDVLSDAGVKVVYLALDPDAGVESRRLVHRLYDRRIEPRWVEIPAPHKDLGEMSMEGARRVIESAPVAGFDDELPLL